MVEQFGIEIDGSGEHEWPHDHSVDWGNNKKPRPPYEGPNGEKTNPSFC